MQNFIVRMLVGALLLLGGATGLTASDYVYLHIDQHSNINISVDGGNSWELLADAVNAPDASLLRFRLDAQVQLHYSIDAGAGWTRYLKPEPVINYERLRPEDIEGYRMQGPPEKEHPLMFTINSDGEAFVSTDGGYNFVRDEHFDKSQPGISQNTQPLNSGTPVQFVPHPLVGDAAALINVSQKSNVYFVIFGLDGKPVATLANGIFEAGQHRLPINPAQLAQGVYSYSLHIGDAAHSGALVIAR